MKQELELTTKNFKQIRIILGRKYVKSKVESSFDFINIANKGVNANVIKNFRKHFNLSLGTTAHMLNTSEPTIYRLTKSNKNLKRNFSIKLFEITKLFIYGSDVFGNKENFFKWLNLPNTALGGLEPIDLIDLPEGISKVRDVIGRIEHGIYS